MSAENSGAGGRGGRHRSYSLRALFENLTSPSHFDEEEDDDGGDPDYEPEDAEEAEEDEEQEEEDDDDFYDATDDFHGVEDDAEDEESTGGAGSSRHAQASTGPHEPIFRVTASGVSVYLTESQIEILLRRPDIEVEDWDPDGPERMRRRIMTPPDPNRFPVVPSEEGRKLMDSGIFGAPDRSLSQKKVLAQRILDRELGIGDRAAQRVNQSLMAQDMIPATEPEMVIQYEDPVCCGQFSDDGNFFYACVKDFRVRLYDTSNPYNWKHYKTVSYPFGQWTLTDADLSPDNRWLVYSSLQSNVCFTPTDPNDTGDPYTLDLAGGNPNSRTQGRWWAYHSAFPIYSVRFSGDGRELVAGTGADAIVVYDIESRRVLHHVQGHDHDVNAVCFADKSSSHILYSGSDDTLIKVWDRRSMGDSREAGAFVGHIEGLTYIDSKGDGRYILSNAKECSMKLWDLRMAMSTSRFQHLEPTQHTRRSDHDYRSDVWDDHNYYQHKCDNSLVTFRGHRVQRTLIRCHFSPPGSTNSRYVYSGSQDGYVYVWNLDATLAAKIDVTVANASAQPLQRGFGRGRTGGHTLVRDVGWHPNAPLLVASNWNGRNHNSGTATLHSYNETADDEAEPRMGISVNDKLGDHIPEVYY